MAQQISVDPAARTGSTAEGGIRQIAPDLAYMRVVMVNVIFWGLPHSGGAWTLIDTGLPGSAGMIRAAAEARFGPNAKPAAILMTHGHFDHAGTLPKLAEHWQVPIYAHPYERPYLDGSRSYPPPDPTVGGGLLAAVSALYPRRPTDVSSWLHTLPEDGSVPFMPGWRWIHTPGHTPGHVSFWRESDRAMIAGDAFITTAQESAFAVATQRPELHGPPMYLTPDWTNARASVRALAAMNPALVVTGHGPAMRGPEMLEALHALSRDFDDVALPKRGRYLAGSYES